VSASDTEVQKEGSSRAPIIKELSNVICKMGLVVLEGSLVLTPNEIKMVSDSGATDDETTTSKAVNNKKKEKNSSKQQHQRNFSTAISIPLESIESMTYEVALGRPSLSIKWTDSRKTFGRGTKTQFLQKRDDLPREEKIVNWIPIIDAARFLDETTGFPSAESAATTKEAVTEEEVLTTSSTTIEDFQELETQLLQTLDDRDWKGSFQIAKELKENYGSKCDFDQVESLCKDLAKKKLIEEDSMGGFFRKIKNDKTKK